MLFTTRGPAEYRAMFDLTDEDLSGRLLDCCAGGAGLVAAVNDGGGRAVAVDPLYAIGREGVLAEVGRSLAGTQQLIDDHPDQFVWTWYGTPGRRDAMRADAGRSFAEDLVAHPGHYVAAALPRLPFADSSFDLALCSHLLFTWAGRFDEDWHLAAILELARVAAEVRVFPLVRAGDGAPVAFLPAVLERLDGAGLSADVVAVPFEFQRGGDRMLRVRGG